MPASYLLDTNILILLVRSGDVGREIDRRFSLRASATRPLICGVTLGEIWALAEVWSYGAEKRRLIQEIVDSCVVVPIDDPLVVQGYVKVYKVLRAAPGGSRTSSGENDMWIAAATRAAGATLLTTDKHFDLLDPTVIRRIRIEDPRGRERQDGR